MTIINETDEFNHDVEKLSKKYSSFDADLNRFINALITNRDFISNKHRLQLGEKYSQYKVFKVKSFRCKALGGGSNSGIRIIYYDDTGNDTIVLLEAYCKKKQENETKSRIITYLDNLSMSKS